MIVQEKQFRRYFRTAYSSLATFETDEELRLAAFDLWLLFTTPGGELIDKTREQVINALPPERREALEQRNRGRDLHEDPVIDKKVEERLFTQFETLTFPKPEDGLVHRIEKEAQQIIQIIVQEISCRSLAEVVGVTGPFRAERLTDHEIEALLWFLCHTPTLLQDAISALPVPLKMSQKPLKDLNGFWDWFQAFYELHNCYEVTRGGSHGRISKSREKRYEFSQFDEKLSPEERQALLKELFKQWQPFYRPYKDLNEDGTRGSEKEHLDFTKTVEDVLRRIQCERAIPGLDSSLLDIYKSAGKEFEYYSLRAELLNRLMVEPADFVQTKKEDSEPVKPVSPYSEPQHKIEINDNGDTGFFDAKKEVEVTGEHKVLELKQDEFEEPQIYYGGEKFLKRGSAKHTLLQKIIESGGMCKKGELDQLSDTWESHVKAINKDFKAFASKPQWKLVRISGSKVRIDEP